MTAEDEFFNTEHPHGRDGLGPAPDDTVRAWLAGHGPGPDGWNGDGASAARANVTYRTRGEYMTAGVLRNALNWADDDARIEVRGRELRVFYDEKD